MADRTDQQLVPNAPMAIAYVATFVGLAATAAVIAFLSVIATLS